MFSFFRKKPASEPAPAPPPDSTPSAPAPATAQAQAEAAHDTWRARLGRWGRSKVDEGTPDEDTSTSFDTGVGAVRADGTQVAAPSHMRSAFERAVEPLAAP